MEEFFQDEFYRSMLWLEALPANQSSFVQFSRAPINDFGVGNSITGLNHGNMNKRMIEFWKRNWNTTIETREPQKERCYRHMINERMRREKQRQSYSALHSVLPLETKSDKHSIIQMAVKRIRDMQRYKEATQRRNEELEKALLAMRNQKEGGTKIRFKVPNPSSGIDSMVEVLKCLKSLGLETSSIESEFSSQELLATLEIDGKVGVDEVATAVRRRLSEA